jgi:hypothetical protein
MRRALVLTLAAFSVFSLGFEAHAADAAVVEACQQAARQALAGAVAHPADVAFVATPEFQAGLSNDSQTVLRGVARWQSSGGVRSVVYNCSVDPRTMEVIGVVMRDASPVGADTAPARPPAEPDLSRLSPEACEARAAEALKQRWPRVSEISFDVATRSFQQQSSSKAEFHGSGRAMPDPRSPSTFFAFDCEIDPRDGRVQRASLSW